MLAGKVTLVTEAPPELAANLRRPDVDERLTVMARGLRRRVAKVSSSVTVKAVVAEELAVAREAVRDQELRSGTRR